MTNKYDYKGYFIVPNTINDLPKRWEYEYLKNKNIIELEMGEDDHKIFFNSDIYLIINETTNLLIDIYEDEIIPYDKLDIAIKITEKSLITEKDNETRRVINDYLLKMLYLAKEKKTLLALYL